MGMVDQLWPLLSNPRSIIWVLYYIYIGIGTNISHPSFNANSKFSTFKKPHRWRLGMMAVSCLLWLCDLKSILKYYMCQNVIKIIIKFKTHPLRGFSTMTNRFTIHNDTGNLTTANSKNHNCFDSTDTDQIRSFNLFHIPNYNVVIFWSAVKGRMHITNWREI
jgi:hypothetical protein